MLKMITDNLHLYLPVLLCYFVWFRAAELGVLLFTLRKRDKEKRWKILFSVWWKIIIVHVAAYAVVSALNLFIAERMSEIFTDYYTRAETVSVEWLIDFSEAIMTDPSKSPSSFIFEIIMVALAGLIIFLGARRIFDNMRATTLTQATRSGILLAVVTAPWTFLLPAFWL